MLIIYSKSIKKCRRHDILVEIMTSMKLSAVGTTYNFAPTELGVAGSVRFTTNMSSLTGLKKFGPLCETALV